MAKTKPRGGAPLPKPLVAVIAGLALAAAVAAFMLLGRTAEETWGIESVYVLGDGNLLFVERSGLDNDNYDKARLRIVARSGHELRRSESVYGTMKANGLVGGGVWIDSHEGGLELWTLAELAPLPGAKAAWAGTPALAQRRDVHGTTSGVLTLRGADDRFYTVDSGYRIEQQAKGFRPELPMGIPHAVAGDAALDETDLVRPHPIAAPAGGALVLDGGKGMLALSNAADGSNTTATLSRVDRGAALRWSVTAQQLVTPTELENPYFTFPLVDLVDGVVFVVAQATSVQSSRGEDSSRTWAEHEVRLVDLDPEDGRVLSSRSIVVPQ